MKHVNGLTSVIDSVSLCVSSIFGLIRKWIWRCECWQLIFTLCTEHCLCTTIYSHSDWKWKNQAELCRYLFREICLWNFKLPLIADNASGQLTSRDAILWAWWAAAWHAACHTWLSAPTYQFDYIRNKIANEATVYPSETQCETIRKSTAVLLPNGKAS